MAQVVQIPSQFAHAGVALYGWYTGVLGGLNRARDAAYDSGTGTLEADDDNNAG